MFAIEPFLVRVRYRYLSLNAHGAQVYVIEESNISNVSP